MDIRSNELCVLFFLVFTTSSYTLDMEEDEYDVINDIMVDLSQYVMENYMTNGQGCITVVSDSTKTLNLPSYNATTLIRIAYESSGNGKCDEDMKFKLAPCFNSYCTNYVVQISDPVCFIASWNEANYEYFGLKHTPRLLFLPLLPFTTNFSETLYAFKGSEVSADILVADYVENGTDGWYVNIYSNNFYEHPGQPGREGSILLDKWLPSDGFEANTDLYPDKTQNLHGKELRVHVVEYPPYTQNDPPDGTEVQLIKLFCEVSNCSITTITDEYDWGDINPTNVTANNGCTGQVYIDNADICIGANYAWIRFWPFLDFSISYYSGGLTVVVPKPAALGGWSTPFLPFSAVLWASVFFCAIISTVGLFGITKATLKYVPRYREKLIENDKFLTLSDSFIRSIGMMVLQQPQQFVPGSPVRHLFTSLEIIYLVVTTCYAAELYDFLTVPRTQKPIENIHDLADSNTIWMGNSDAYLLLIKNSDDPKILKAVDNFRVLPEEQIAAIGERGGYGMVCERLLGGHFVELPFITNKFVELSITMKENYVQSALFVYLKKGSPYTKRMDQIIGRMDNAGLMYKWEDDCSARQLDYAKQQKLLESTKKVIYPPKVLKVSDLEGAFVVYFAGIFVSIVFFVAEVYHGKKKGVLVTTT